MPAVTLDTVSKIYPGSRAGVRDVSLRVADGERLVLVGPSGAGKSTLLRLVAGLETPDAGRVLFDDTDVTRWPPHRRGVALVAQKPALYPHLNVGRNLAIGVELRQAAGRWRRRLLGRPDPVPAAELAARVAEAARVLGLTNLLDRRPHQISGGEQQRVALGRAFVTRAAVWLLDEPFAHLDLALRARVRGELHLLRGRLGATMMDVTHDPVEARALGQRVAVLRAGTVEQTGPTADVYDRPRSRFVATSLGWPPMNMAD